MGSWFNLTGLVTGAFLLFVSHSLYHFYQLFTPEICNQQQGNCLLPVFRPTSEGLFPLLQLRVYTSASHRQLGSLATVLENFQIADSCQKKVNISLPPSTLRNGTLFVHCYLLPHDYSGEDPYSANWNVQQSGQLTTYQVPSPETFRLISDKREPEKARDKKNKFLRDKAQTPIAHLHSVLSLAASYEMPNFANDKIPGELRHLLNVHGTGGKKYLPLFYLDELSFRSKDLIQVKPSESLVELTIDYRPVSIGKLRLLNSILMSLQQLKNMGFTEKDIDEVKGVFVDTNLYLLTITVFVSSLHLLFDALSFKNDISFWKNRKSMVGLSTKALLWRCFSYTVIFFYLLDQDTSLLVLIPSGISVLIEYWKVTKAFKVSYSFYTGLKWGTQSAAEVETDAFDTQAMKYLSWLMIPLCISGAGYSLMYIPHKSWYSWILESMANGVYAFGFLFMLPQLFVNYKLKSVAHLPWRAFMYKAFNTFIDDLFAFIITMPTAHRVACFRDDIVFLIYLYQRYLYPVDHKRMNEYGEIGEEAEGVDNTTTEKHGEKIIQKYTQAKKND